MRSMNQKRGLRRGAVGFPKLGALVLVLVAALPFEAMAQGKSCNPDLDFRISDPGPYFVGDPMRVSANIGARDISLGNYMEIESFGFALNCHTGEDFFTCTDAGNLVEFTGQPTTDCLNAEGDPAQLLVPQRNIIPIKVQGPPIRTAADSQCNVQFDMSIVDLARDDQGNITNNTIVQAMGWPIDGGEPAKCDNGLTSAASSTISYNVETCGIEVKKQVSTDNETWVDADTPESALSVGSADTAYYRLIVENTSSVDYLGQMQVSDPLLGFNGAVDGLASGQEIILNESNGFDVTAICAELGEGEFTFTNTASVEGVCRSGDHPLGQVLASGSDVAVISCKPYDIHGNAEVLIEKSTNGEDADQAPGPIVEPGSLVTWDYVVYNTGEQPLILDQITDDLEGDIECEKAYLDVQEFTNCTAKTGTAVAGQYANIATVNATAAGNGKPVSDTDPSHYFARGEPPVAVINVVKSVEDLTTNNDGSVDVAYKVTVSNTGGQAGIYDLVDTLMINEGFAPHSIVSNVAYLAGTENDQSGTLGAPPLADYTTGATLVSNETLAEGLNESFVFTLRFSVDYAVLTPEGANCIIGDNAGNTGLTNHVDVYVGGTIVDQDEACGGITLQPSMAVLKEVFDGEDWLDANDVTSAAVKYIGSGAVYRVTVTNTGPVDLENVVISDPMVGLDNFIVNGGFLAVGQTVVVTESEAPALSVAEVCDVAGSIENTVTAGGTGAVNGTPVNASDNAFVRCVGKPNIEVKKYISIDDGATFLDGTAGPVEAPSGALYKITVENIGQVNLVNVTVDDSRIPGGPYTVGSLAVGELVTITSGEWPELDMGQVCGSSGLIENIATVEGTSAELADDKATDADNAKLDCIGPPMVAIMKEVSLNGGADWHDANEPPYPTAVVDAAPDTAEYRLTVGNIGSVTLFNVVVNDTQLGIENYAIGTMAPGESVVLTSGTIAALSVSDICSSRGEKANVAYAKGSSAAGVEDEASDSATIDCIGDPAIRVLKEASKDGVEYSSTSVDALAPSDAYYRITVENIGNVDLENVVINDATLGIFDYVVTGAGGAGSLAMGESVVIAHANAGDNTLAELFVPTLCEGNGDFPNTVIASGKATDSTQTVDDDDSVLFSCEVPVDICSVAGAGQRPSAVFFDYNGTPTGVNVQGAVGTFVNGYSDYSEVTQVNVSDGKSDGVDHTLPLSGPIELDGSYNSTGKADKIPPNIRFEFLTSDGTLVQWIEFHGSCSLPLWVGDEYAGMTIVDYTP